MIRNKEAVEQAEKYLRNLERDHLRQIEAEMWDKGKWADSIRWLTEKNRLTIAKKNPHED